MNSLNNKVKECERADALAEQLDAKAEQKPAPTLDAVFKDEAKKLAALSPMEYDRAREAKAEALGVRVATLDSEVKSLRKKSKTEEMQGSEISFPDIQPWPETVNGSDLLLEIRNLYKRFTVLPKHTDNVLAVWTVFTYATDLVHVAPILVLQSPVMRCGKSTVLTILSRTTYRAKMSANIPPAALFRMIAKYSPTLLIDEADSFLTGKNANEELRGLLNAGHFRETATITRCVGDDHEPREFSTWGAKAIALIGTLPATIEDRSITVLMRRKTKDEKTEKLRHTDRTLFTNVSRKCRRFVDDNAEAIKSTRPVMPDELNDRAADNWEPLFILARLAGGQWPEWIKQDALTISSTKDDDSDSIRVQLLTDIQKIFEEKGDRIFSADLISALAGMPERPWSEYHHGKPITQRQLANQLRQFQVLSNTLRVGDDRAKGYTLEQFTDAFSRYIPLPSRDTVTSLGNKAFSADSIRDTKNVVTDEISPKSLEIKPCHAVTDKNRGNGWETEL